MIRQLSKLIPVVFLVSSFFAFEVYASPARDITNEVSISAENLTVSKITDKNLYTRSAGNDVSIAISSNVPMGGIYIKFDGVPKSGLLDGKTEISADEFVHEYIPLGGAVQAELSYPETAICDISVYSEGELPADVQVWQKGDPDTDILLCATHSDDDQLFFAGLLPHYAGHVGANVRVAYFINHYDTYNRTHELLDGLWHCGVKNYPDISPFPDGYSESVDGAVKFLEAKGFSYDDMLSFQRELLQKYKPLTVVLHDFKGEYGHGAHMLNTKSFIEVCETTPEGQYVPEKIYVHLYGENEIILDIDKPLDEFGGKTAFNVSQEAFGFHKSQHWTWFYEWIYGSSGSVSKASQIRTYSPTKYGLYYTSVGADVEKNDILENVETYAERRQKAEIRETVRNGIADKIRSCISAMRNTGSVPESDIPDENTAEPNENITMRQLGVILASAVIFLAAVVLLIIKNKKKR